MKKNLSLGLAAIVLTLPLATSIAFAAGDHADGHGPFAFGAPGNPAEVDRTLEVMLEDTYFEPEEIQVNAGETIRFVLQNNGALVHEFNIGTPEMHEEHQAEMRMMVEHGVLEPDKINREMMKMKMADGRTMEHDDPNSLLLEPQDTAEIIWTFSEPMTLEFACNVPGHYDAGMAGMFEFVEKLALKQR